ncbi:MAG: ABC transporter permease, partial [Opitutaceae bacterium]
MAESPDPPRAVARAAWSGDDLEVFLEGVWRVTAPRPSWKGLVEERTPGIVRLRAGELGRWDSSLPLFVFAAQQWARERGIACDTDALPTNLREVLAHLARSHETSVPVDRAESFLTNVGLATADTWAKARAILGFVGECVLGVQRLARPPGKFRWGDCLGEMQQCGAMALPIVSLISFLVGVTLAY